MSTKQKIVFPLSLGILIFLALSQPLNMTLAQSLTLGVLAVAILWWGTEVIPQSATSLILLGSFLLVSQVSPVIIFSFPLSENFLLIALSFLFSHGIHNSGLAQRLMEPMLGRFASTVPRLLFSMVLCSFVAALFIPQSISRTLVVATLFSDFLERNNTPRATKAALLFGLFFTGILVGLLFPRGDIVLNYSLMAVSGIPISDLQWITYLAPPTLCILFLACLLFLFLFRRELSDYHCQTATGQASAPLTGKEWLDLLLIVATVILWATEPFHGISGTWIVFGGTLALFLSGTLGTKDWRALDVRVLLFLTAAFSIGGVMTTSGIANLLFQGLGRLLPSEFSWQYALVILLCTMCMHMLLGSNVTSLAVAVPILMTVSSQAAPPLVVLFLIYLAVSQHFLLPFHHVTLAIGVGKDYFSKEQVLRLGMPLTLLVLAGGLFLYLNWWRILGLIP